MYRHVTGSASRAAAAAVTLSHVRSVSEYKFGQAPLSKSWIGTTPRTPKPCPTTVKCQEEKVQVTQLHNGARVITQQRHGATVSVGAYILAGPAYDPVECPGLHHVLHFALTTSNYNNSLFQLDRSIRSTGAAFSHFEKNKHFIGIRLDARSDMWKCDKGKSKKPDEKYFKLNLVQDTIFTAISAPRFHETDIERFRDTMDNNLKELRWQHPAEYAIQKLETVAFYKEPLGNPRHVPENNNGNITSKVLLDQYAKYITPDRIVIAGVNVEHGALIAEYENTPFPHSSSAPHHAALAKGYNYDAVNEQKQYTPNERHEHENRPKEMGTKPDMNTESIVAVGYLSFGRSKATIKHYAASMVFQQLYNMTIQDSVRYERGGNREGVRSFYMPYQSAGLLGFTAIATPENIVRMVTGELRNMQEIKVDDAASIAAAKQRAIVDAIGENWDTVRDLCDYLGTSLPLAANTPSSTLYLSPEEVLEAIRTVTAADLKHVKDCAMGAKPSLFCHGEVLTFPSMRQLGF